MSLQNQEYKNVTNNILVSISDFSLKKGNILTKDCKFHKGKERLNIYKN